MTFELGNTTVALLRDGKTRLIENQPGPPERVDGHTIGVPVLSEPPPHNGEMHPDGDEILILLSGRITVTLEEPNGNRRVELLPGQGLIVPRGVWHQLTPEEPSQLIHVTPGPGGDHRPL